MTFVNPKSKKIATAFASFTNTGDKTLIQEFSCDEIEFALIQYYRDKGDRHYIAMERRIDELKDLEKSGLIKREKWKERGIGILGTVVAGLILYGIIHLITKLS